MTLTPWIYRLGIRLGVGLAPAIGVFDPKVRAGVRARRASTDRLERWASRERGTAPLVWFHASSVGEGLQAESVLRELQRLRPECQMVYTHFSPSGETLARRLPVHVADYLPYDVPAAVDRLLAALRPDLLVFSKLDLWPELATRAAAREIPVVLIAATVSPGSSRLRWPARALLAPGYQAVSLAAAISSDDAERLTRLGVAADRIEVLGDPRYDSVDARVRSIPADDPLLHLGGPHTLVAGSTWPADEAVLVEAFADVRTHQPDARLIVVPHEPTANHLRAVERMAARHRLPAPVRLSGAAEPVPFLLVDRVGVLAALYGAGSMAYVGGGFGRAGLHSVLEPAAWGVPVVYGPRWNNSRDAGELLREGAGVAVDNSAELREVWATWLADEARRHAQGRRARAVVDAGAGAAQRTAISLSRLLRTSPPEARPAQASVR